MASERLPEPGVTGEAPALTCEVCCKEIPPSEDFISEARDYVVYLCGVDCYAAWHSYVDRQGSGGEDEESRRDP
jgi:hypothetical protein